jgi:hypothetical protein
MSNNGYAERLSSAPVGPKADGLKSPKPVGPNSSPSVTVGKIFTARR